VISVPEAFVMFLLYLGIPMALMFHGDAETKRLQTVRQASVGAMMADASTARAVASFVDSRCHETRWWHLEPRERYRDAICGELSAKLVSAQELTAAIRTPTAEELGRDGTAEGEAR